MSPAAKQVALMVGVLVAAQQGHPEALRLLAALAPPVSPGVSGGGA